MSFSVRLLSGLLLFALLASTLQVSAATQTIFGPKTYSPGILKPGDYQDQFAATAVTGNLKITNGDGRDIQLQICSGNIVQKLLCQVNNLIIATELALTRPTSFSVEINGSVVATQTNLPAQKGSLQIGAALKKGQNSLRVKVAGSYLSKIKIEVEQVTSATNQSPIASFQMSTSQGFAPLTVSVNALGSVDPDGQIVDYLWDFGDGFFGNGPIGAHVFLEYGNYNIKLTVRDNQGATSSKSQTVRVIQNQIPIADLRVLSPKEGYAPLMVMFDASHSKDPENGLLNYFWSFEGGDLKQGNVSETHEFKSAGNHQVRLTVVDENGGTASTTVQISVVEPVLPVRPEEVAPSLSEAPSFEQKVGFIYSGANPIQRDVQVDKIDPKRVSLVRGRVLDENGVALSGVLVRVLNENEFGSTLTRIDGAFDLAVNSGAEITIDAIKNGYTRSQRKLEMSSQDYFTMSDIQLTKLDSEVSEVMMGVAHSQVIQGSKASDDSGDRTPTLIFPEANSAKLVMPDGSERPVSELNIRITEFTVGENGLQKMPAVLPKNSAYTYAVEISSDEAIALGASGVQFARPVSYYVDNFLNIPVGSAVPVGEYDYSKGNWKADVDGIVLSILSKEGGIAQLDLGKGRPATSAELAVLGITSSELSDLAKKYESGKSLWRMSLSHFSTYDFNYAANFIEIGSAVGSLKASVLPVDVQPKINGPCKTGCIIEPDTRNVKEVYDIQDSPISLIYSAARTMGRTVGNAVIFKVADEYTPSLVKRIVVQVSVAGKVSTYIYAKDHFDEIEWVWDGLDVYGRALDVATVKVSVGYVFPESYAIVPYNEETRSFGAVPYRGQALIARGETTVWGEFSAELKSGGRSDVQLARKSANGWSINLVHQFDPKTNAIHFGTGGSVYLSSLPKVYKTIAGQGGQGFSGDGGPARFAKLNRPSGVTKAADGSVYIADSGNNRIRKIDVNGTITTVVGSGLQGVDGDGGPAEDASLNFPTSVQLDRNGTLYIADAGNHCIRKVENNIISTIVGKCGEGGDVDQIDPEGKDLVADTPALEVRLNQPKDIVLSSDGSIYISDTGNGKIRKLSTNGFVQRIAGFAGGETLDIGEATRANLKEPRVTGIDRNGALYVAESGANKIRRIFGNSIQTIIGTGLTESNGLFLGPLETNIGNPQFAIPDKEGKIFYSDNINKRISYLDLNDYTNPMIGYVPDNYTENDYATGNTASLNDVQGLYLDNDGSKIIADAGAHKVGTFGYVQFDLNNGVYTIPSEDTSEVYVFDSKGKHLRTLYGRTGKIKYSFEYDSDANVLAVVDSFQNRTEFVRSGKRLSSIVGVHGQRTSFSVDSSGYLSGITQPGGESTEITYTSTGLMTSFKKPNGNISTYEYAPGGLLSKENNPAGGFQTFVSANASTIEYATGGGKRERYYQQFDEDGYERIVKEQDYWQDQDTVYAGWRWRLNRDFTEVDERYQYDPRSRGMSKYVGYSYQWMEGAATEQNVQRTYQFRNNDYFNYTMEEKMTYGEVSRPTVRRYDSATRTESITSPEGRVSIVQMDDWERPIFAQVGNLDAVNITYDNEGNISRVKQGDRQTIFGYDSLGRMIQITDALGNTISFGYDSNNRVISRTLADGSINYFSYDLNSNVAAIKPPDRDWHLTPHNSLDLLSSYLPPQNGGAQNWKKLFYDGDRNLMSEQLSDGTQTTYSYYNAKLYSMAQNGATRFFSFDYSGKFASIVGSDINPTRYKYTGSVVSGIGGYQDNLAYMYSSNPARISSEWVGSGTIGSTFSVNVDADNIVTNFGDLYLRYNDNGLLSSVNLKKVSDLFEYNSLGEVIKKQTSIEGNEFYSELYKRDLLGRIIEKSVIENSGNKKFNYSYDPNGKLVEVKVDGVVSSTYSYDAQGNRLRQGYEYDVEDRLVKANGNSYVYNAKGELIKKLNIQSGEETQYTYDMLGVLTKVVLPSGQVIQYMADGFGRRAARFGNLTYTDYIYDVNGRIVGSSGGMDHYVYGEHSHSPDGMFRNLVYYKFIKDQVGSIRFVVNADTGQVVQNIEYDEFGVVLKDTNPRFQPFGYAGGLYDLETKLVRFGARDYDPEIGRWIQKDPIGFDGGDTNLFSYVANDPINFVDPRGLWALQIGGSISGLLGPLFGVGGSAESGIAISYSAQYGFQFAGYQSAGVRAGTGLYGGMSLNLSWTQNAQRVSDLNGGGITKGFDTPIGGYSKTTSGGTCGNPSMTTHTIGFGPGVIGDAYWGGTGTWVGAPLTFGGSQ